MATFSFTREKIDEAALRKQLFDPTAGGYTSFEGWVRNHNEGLAVRLVPEARGHGGWDPASAYRTFRQSVDRILAGPRDEGEVEG